ncbi:unnamed protein product [Rhodiola kirilowii]
MTNLVKLDFSPLDIAGTNYMYWTMDIEIYLQSMSLIETINEGNKPSKIDMAKSLIFIRRHLHEDLKNEYLTVKKPCELWKNIKERYDHQKVVMLLIYRDEWTALWFQAFKKVSEYNSAMFRIVTHLRFCGDIKIDDEMLEKTFSTFHASKLTLQQQYRVRGFQRYSELIASLLIEEKNNELLIKNHQSRPTGSKAFPEANAVRFDRTEHRDHLQGREHSRGHGRGRGRGQGRGRGGYFHNSPYKITKYGHKNHQDGRNYENPYKKKNDRRPSKGYETTCFRCGTKSHWAKVCRAPKHLCELYQKFEKGKGKEVNFIENPINDSTHFDASDFVSLGDNLNEHTDDGTM